MNKSKIKILQIMTLAIGVFSLSACLNDETPNNLINGAKSSYSNQNFVEVHLTSNDNSNVLSQAYDAINRDTTIVKFIPVNLTSGPAKTDVKVTFQVLDTTNAVMKQVYVDSLGYIIPDPSQFTVLNSNNQVTIPAGQSTGYIQVKFNPANFLGNTYIFGIKLTAVSDSKYQLSNLTTGFVQFGIKNKYDGAYMLNGTMTDTFSALTGAYPNEVYLITQDATSVAMWDVAVGGYAHLIMSGTSYSYYGAFSPQFIFDSNNNVTSVINAYGQGAGSLKRSAMLDTTTPGVVNKYDPATKTLKVTYWLVQKGVNRTHFDETFTYIGPR